MFYTQRQRQLSTTTTSTTMMMSNERMKREREKKQNCNYLQRNTHINVRINVNVNAMEIWECSKNAFRRQWNQRHHTTAALSHPNNAFAFWSILVAHPRQWNHCQKSWTFFPADEQLVKSQNFSTNHHSEFWTHIDHLNQSAKSFRLIDVFISRDNFVLLFTSGNLLFVWIWHTTFSKWSTHHYHHTLGQDRLSLF